MKTFLIAVATLLIAVSLGHAAESRLADYQRVVMDDTPLPVTQMAAEELAAYAGRVAGKKLEIVPLSKYQNGAPGLSFFVGEKAAEAALGHSPAPWKMEEYVLQSVPSGLVLAGHDAPGVATSLNIAAGSQLATYTLLDDYLGVKWIWPGDSGEHVPVTPDAVIPSLNIRTTPANAIRRMGTGYSSYDPPAVKQDIATWSRRTRQGWVMSAWFGHSWFYAFELRGGAEKSAYFQKHPEWFAEVNGKRRPPQMCTSNPQVIDRMVEFVLADKSNITSISPSDGGGFCQCSACTALDVPGVLSYDGKNPQLSDRIMTYANTVARKVRERDPNKGVGMFAYTYYNRAPINIKQLEPNLYLSFVFQSQAFLDPIAHHEWRQNIDGWQKIGAKMIVREGWGNHYLLNLPFPIEKHINNSLKEAHELGFVGAYGEGVGAFGTQAPNAWAVVRSMWDPQGDGDKRMEEFYRVAYGPAADAMKEYWATYRTALETNWANRRMIVQTRGVPYVNIINSWRIVYPPSVAADAEKHLKAAEAMSLPEEYAGRIKLARAGQDYAACMTELLTCYSRLCDMGMKLDSFRPIDNPPPPQPGEMDAVLKRAFELGERREDLLLAHRNSSALDIGLYAFTNDRNIRQWHGAVKKALKIDKPTRITKALLQGEPGSNSFEENAAP